MNEGHAKCWHCGGEGEVVAWLISQMDVPWTGYGITCTECGAEAKALATEVEAWEWWNTRPIEDALRAELATVQADRDSWKRAATEGATLESELAEQVEQLRAELAAVQNVFDLQPLSRRLIMVAISGVQPGQVHLISDDSDDER
jgi:hypothetical protein